MNALRRTLPPFSRDAWLFLAAVVVGGVAFSIFQLYFNLYVLARGLDKQALGLLSAIPYGVVLAAGLPAGLLADRIGRKAALIWANVAMACGMAVVASSASAGLIALGLMLFGLGEALGLLATAPFIMQISDQRTRTSLFSAQFGLETLAGFGGSLLAGYMPAWLGRALLLGADSAPVYGLTLLAGGGLILIRSAPLWLIHDPARSVDHARAAARTSLADLWRQLTRPLIVKLVAPNFIAGFGAAILIPYFNVFFKERFSISDELLGLLFSLAALTTGLAILLGPWLEQHLRSKVRAVVAVQASSLPFIFIIGFWPNLWVAAGASLVRGALMNTANPLFQAFSMEQLPDHERATVNGIQTITWNVGWTFGPAISGFIQQRYGFAPLFITTAILYTTATLLTYAFFRKTEAEARRPAMGTAE
jgi:MFS family permease